MIVNIKGRGEVLETFAVTSRYGAQESFRDHAHLGMDYSMNIGTELHPLMDGVVTKIVDQGSEGLGKGVYVQMENGDTAIYGHLSEVNVSVGEQVDPSDVIGLSGSTGASTGGHLHLGIKDSSGSFQDPSEYESIVQSWDAAQSYNPGVGPVDLLIKGLEKGRDAGSEKITEWSGDALIWLLESLKEAGIYVGKWLILMGPDISIILSMIFCIGAICSIPKAGKWTSASVAAAMVLEVVRKSMQIG